MRISHTYEGYNPRRYGRPWIAKITSWPIGGKPTLEFGSLVGNMTEIAAAVGDIIRSGQRDLRGNNSMSDWEIVIDEAGDTIEVTIPEARDYWLAREAGTQAQWLQEHAAAKRAETRRKLWRKFWYDIGIRAQGAHELPDDLTVLCERLDTDNRTRPVPQIWYLDADGVVWMQEPDIPRGRVSYYKGLEPQQIERLRKLTPEIEAGDFPADWV